MRNNLLVFWFPLHSFSYSKEKPECIVRGWRWRKRLEAKRERGKEGKRVIWYKDKINLEFYRIVLRKRRLPDVQTMVWLGGVDSPWKAIKRVVIEADFLRCLYERTLRLRPVGIHWGGRLRPSPSWSHLRTFMTSQWPWWRTADATTIEVSW